MKLLRIVGVITCMFVLAVGPVAAQAPATKQPGLQTTVLSGAALAAGLGMGLTIIGAGIGLGRIGSAALESMARQPEVAPRVQTAMLIIAAMLEGATLASVVLCFLVAGSATF